jgi:hypothetical protein
MATTNHSKIDLYLDGLLGGLDPSTRAKLLARDPKAWALMTELVSVQFGASGAAEIVTSCARRLDNERRRMDPARVDLADRLMAIAGGRSGSTS